MRLGVLDVGSNTVHLLVVDAHRGAAPLPAYSHKTELRLAEHLDKDGKIAQSGADGLVSFVKEAAELAEDKGCESVLAFATSALREAPNGEKVLDRVRKETEIDLQVLTREGLTADPPQKDEVRALRKRIRIEMAAVAGTVLRAGKPQRSVATSKTF